MPINIKHKDISSKMNLLAPDNISEKKLDSKRSTKIAQYSI